MLSREAARDIKALTSPPGLTLICGTGRGFFASAAGAGAGASASGGAALAGPLVAWGPLGVSVAAPPSGAAGAPGLAPGLAAPANPAIVGLPGSTRPSGRGRPMVFW